MATVDANQPVLVYRTTDGVELRSLAALLEEADIETHLVGEVLDGVYSGLNIGRMSEKEIWVAARDQAAAGVLVSEWRCEHNSPRRESSNRTWVLHAAWILALLFLLLIGLPF